MQLQYKFFTTAASSLQVFYKLQKTCIAALQYKKKFLYCSCIVLVRTSLGRVPTGEILTVAAAGFFDTECQNMQKTPKSTNIRLKK